jgi:hypothetical protein
MENTTKLFNALIDGEYFNEQELHLITAINGYSVDTLNDCIYARYGFRDYEQLTENS